MPQATQPAEVSPDELSPDEVAKLSADEVAASRERRRKAEPATLYRGPDTYAKIVAFMVKWRSRLPGWRVETMGVLTTSEAEGIILLEAAAHTVSDQRLRKLFNKHLADERRHNAGFQAIFDRLQRDAGREPKPPPSARPMAKKFNLMGLMAYLEIQELRGEQVMRIYRHLFRGDDDATEFIDSVLRDEKFHATYTHLQLERWAREGMADQVRAARAEAEAVDRQAFWVQLLRFLRVLPRLVLAGHMPPLFGSKPAPM